MNADSLALVIVAAGTARRMEGIDKIWSDMGGHPLVWHSLHQLASAACKTVLVVKSEDLDRAAELSEAFPNVVVVTGAAERQFSVKRGLEALSDQTGAIAVHDAARPFATPSLLQAGYEALAGADGAVPVIEVPDTIKRVDSMNTILETVDRGPLRAAQTPQVFRAEALRNAHEIASRSNLVATDDASLLEREGYTVVCFPGSRTNVKITTPQDLHFARAMYEKMDS